MLNRPSFFTPQKKKKKDDVDEEERRDPLTPTPRVPPSTRIPFPVATPTTATKARRQLFSLAPADLGTSFLSPPPAKRARSGEGMHEEKGTEDEDFPSESLCLPRTPKKVSPMVFLGLTPKGPPNALKRTLLRARKSPMAFFKAETSLVNAKRVTCPEPAPKMMKTEIASFSSPPK